MGSLVMLVMLHKLKRAIRTRFILSVQYGSYFSSLFSMAENDETTFLFLSYVRTVDIFRFGFPEKFMGVKKNITVQYHTVQRIDVPFHSI